LGEKPSLGDTTPFCGRRKKKLSPFRGKKVARGGEKKNTPAPGGAALFYSQRAPQKLSLGGCGEAGLREKI